MNRDKTDWAVLGDCTIEKHEALTRATREAGRRVTLSTSDAARGARTVTNLSARMCVATVKLLGWVLCAYPAWATTLDLGFVDTGGHPVHVTKAELLLVAWGQEERIELKTTGDSLTLHLEPEWLQSRWPRSSQSARSRFSDQLGVYLYLQAPPPLAAMQSDRFRWPTGAARESANQGDTTTITFPREQQAVVPEGADPGMALVFRPKVPRRVRFVDSHGKPQRNLAVGVNMFWSDENHCAVLTGREWLGSHVTDEAGWIEVPDGEFVYALGVREPYRFDVPPSLDSPTPWRLVTRLPGASTEFVVRELAVRPLELRVRRGGEPAAGIHLRGVLATCICGACDGPLGTTDEGGRIRLDDFRPERLSEIWLVDGDTEVWRSWPGGGVIEVDL